jgi:hypothetical protein
MEDYEEIRPQAFQQRRRAFDTIVGDLRREPRRKSFTITLGECGLVSRFSVFVDDGVFKFRTVTMFVTRDGWPLAGARFRHWRMTDDLFPTAQTLIDAAGRQSAVDLETAEFLSAHWPDELHPLEYGDVVVFERLSVLRPSPDISPLLITAIERQFGKTISLLVLKSDPAWERQDRERSPGFLRRQRAMKNHCRRLLDVAAADGDWMWRAFNGRVEQAFTENP